MKVRESSRFGREIEESEAVILFGEISLGPSAGEEDSRLTCAIIGEATSCGEF